MKYLFGHKDTKQAQAKPEAGNQKATLPKQETTIAEQQRQAEEARKRQETVVTPSLSATSTVQQGGSPQDDMDFSDFDAMWKDFEKTDERCQQSTAKVEQSTAKVEQSTAKLRQAEERYKDALRRDGKKLADRVRSKAPLQVGGPF